MASHMDLVPSGCRVIVNAKEVYLWQGSGVKYFSRSLLRAIGVADIRLGLMVEAYSKSPNPALADTSALQIHQHTRETSISRLRDLLHVRTRPFLRPWRQQYQAHMVAESDPLMHQIEAALNLGAGCQGTHDPVDFRIYQAYRVFSRAQCMFTSKRKLLHLEAPPSSRQETLIFHNPMPFPIVLQGAKNVVTIHDTIALTHPELCLSDPGHEFALMTQLLNTCDAIHAISQQTAASLCSLFGSQIEQKLHVIPQANPQFHELDRTTRDQIVEHKLHLLQRFHETGEGYLLQLGTIEPKKNHLVMLEAFQALRRAYPKLRLVVVGKPGWLCDDTLQSLSSPSAAAEGIEWKGSLPRASLEYYMANALALVFPSLVEGWGLPPLEAMSVGTPPIVSQIPVCIEACAEAALFVREYQNPLAWAAAVRGILDDDALYQEKLSAGLMRAQEFQPADFARDIQKLYASLL
jgi:glycosyltransferase involved in cell wall biosynthesis